MVVALCDILCDVLLVMAFDNSASVLVECGA